MESDKVELTAEEIFNPRPLRMTSAPFLTSSVVLTFTLVLLAIIQTLTLLIFDY